MYRRIYKDFMNIMQRNVLHSAYFVADCCNNLRLAPLLTP